MVRQPARRGKECAQGRVFRSTERSLAAAVAISKSVIIERPILRGMFDGPKPLDSIGSDTGWSMIARLHSQDATLQVGTGG